MVCIWFVCGNFDVFPYSQPSDITKLPNITSQCIYGLPMLATYFSLRSLPHLYTMYMYVYGFVCVCRPDKLRYEDRGWW